MLKTKRVKELEEMMTLQQEVINGLRLNAELTQKLSDEEHELNDALRERVHVLESTLDDANASNEVLVREFKRLGFNGDALAQVPRRQSVFREQAMLLISAWFRDFVKSHRYELAYGNVQAASGDELAAALKRLPSDRAGYDAVLIAAEHLLDGLFPVRGMEALRLKVRRVSGNLQALSVTATAPVPVDGLLAFLASYRGAYVAVEPGGAPEELGPGLVISFPGEPKVLQGIISIPATDETFEYGSAAHLATCTCIGCGCDDMHACHTEGAGEPCSWVRIDRAAGLGVCSSCPTHVTRWDEGDREQRDVYRAKSGPRDAVEHSDGH